MKKFLLTLGLIAGLTSASQASSTVSISVAPGTITNLFNGSALIQNILWTSTAGTGTNSFLKLIDSPTNALQYVQNAYTNISSYATNYSWIYTNYFGVITTNTNAVVLIDVTNAVAATTNAYVSQTIAAAGGSSTYISDPKWSIQYGLWATNTGTGTQPGTITITYITQ